MDDSNIRKQIGTRIAIARKARGLNQDQLAEAVSVHKQTISRWESGKRAPNGEEVRLIVETLKCSADFILGLSDTLEIKR